MQKLIGISAISAIIILSIGILPPPQQDNVITNSVTTQELTQEEIDNFDEEFTFDVDNLQEIEFSIIDTERVFTTSDQSAIEQFLDENDLPSSSEKFGIEVQTVLFDSDLKQYPTSNVIAIPELSITDDQGRVLDLGTIQTSFLGINSDSERGDETSFNLDGTVKFYLDDDLITTKKLYSSETGSNENYKLSILDSIPPTSFDNRPQAFTFTLADEGADWLDKSEHTYRIVVTEINAEINSNENIKKFSWNGEKIAYELKVKVDESKKVVYDYKGEAVSIFKNDSTLQICGYSIYQKENSQAPIQGEKTISPPSVVVRDTSGNILASAEHTATVAVAGIAEGRNQKTWYGVSTVGSCSEKTYGIPRDADIIFTVNDKDYPVHTPKSQINYHLNAFLEPKQLSKSIGNGQTDGSMNTNDGIIKSVCQGRNNLYCAYVYTDVMTSNFGFNDLQEVQGRTTAGIINE